MFGLPEKDVNQAFIFLFPAATVGDKDRYDEYGKGNIALKVDQTGQCVLSGCAINKLRFA